MKCPNCDADIFAEPTGTPSELRLICPHCGNVGTVTKVGPTFASQHEREQFEQGLPKTLEWSIGVPKKLDRQPYLVRFAGSAPGYEVLTWVPERERWCQGFLGLGDDRYTDFELEGVYHALLAQI